MICAKLILLLPAWFAERETSMTEWLDYVDRAFHAIEILGKDEEYMHLFAERWGGLGLDAFARALREGSSRDQQVAAFALGRAGSRWARNLLLPFLSHEVPEVRWA